MAFAWPLGCIVMAVIQPCHNTCVQCVQSHVVWHTKYICKAYVSVYHCSVSTSCNTINSPVNLGPKWAEPTTNCNKNQISTMLHGIVVGISENKSLPKSTEWNISKLRNFCVNLAGKYWKKKDSALFINMGKYMYISNQYGLCLSLIY